ncbi:hypothetical protein [Rhodosalinus sp. 5P4]|uniref:hypothetical protein n=1 Tax=Rhodosalinus sp. 5P4 TaxID=3239196 RepID=UPI003525DBC9
MAKIFDDIKRLEEMQERLDRHFNKSAQYSGDKAAKIAAGYAAVTESIHALKESDAFFNETIRQLEKTGTEESRLEAIRMRRERRAMRPKCDLGGGRERTFE